jgi:inner membrane protein
MDPLTHGLVGALTAQGVTRHRKKRAVLTTGFFAALLADLDTFITSPTDPLLNVEIHRQFTHALIFIPIGALVATLIMFWFQKKHLSLKEVYLISLIGYATSGLLDAFTSYGTQLLWPFTDTRIAWNIISVVDPLVTAGLLLALIMLYRRERHVTGPPRSSVWAWFGMAWLAFFLLLGYIQLQRAGNITYAIARERGHIIDRMVVKPTLGNRVLWRSTYISSDTVYTDGIRLRYFRGYLVYEGDSAPLMVIQDFGGLHGTTQHHDIQRFDRLADGFLVEHPHEPGVIGDARYAMLPTSLVPLWGIRLNPDNPDQHVGFEYFRDASKENRSQLTDMLFGRQE